MARTTAGSKPGSVKFACSYCGVPRFYPSEMKRTAEGFFRCDWHGNETTTNLEIERQQALARNRRTGDAPRFPTGAKADWQS